MLKIFFISVSLILFLGFLCGKLFVFGKQRPVFVGRYAAVLASILVLYCISALLLMPQSGTFERIILILFAASPFIIGRLTTYKTINFYTAIQLAFVAGSVIFALIKI